MIERSSMKALHKFLEHVNILKIQMFEMLRFNQALLHEITSLDEEVQQMFFEVMQTYANLTGESEFDDSDSEFSSLKVTSKINRSDLDENQIARLEELENEMQTHIQLK